MQGDEALEEGELEDAYEEGEIVTPKPRQSGGKRNRARNDLASTPQQTRATGVRRGGRGDWATKQEEDFEFLLKSYVQTRGAPESTECRHVDKKRKRDHERHTPKAYPIVDMHRAPKKNRDKIQQGPVRRDYPVPIAKDNQSYTRAGSERAIGRGAIGVANGHNLQQRKDNPKGMGKVEKDDLTYDGSDGGVAQQHPHPAQKRPDSNEKCQSSIKEAATIKPHSSSKLELIVDIDHTLVHSTTDPKAKDIFETAENADMVHFTLPGQAPVYYVKFRPQVAAFLDLLQPLFDFHIYTMGTRAYAEKIISILDPKKQLFGRILAREDHLVDKTTKNLENYFEEDKVLILDDRDDVWRQSGAANLIKIDPFLFFEGLSDSNAPPLIPLSIQELIKTHPFPTLDNSMVYLDSLVGLLRVIHKEYFDKKRQTPNNPVDVREVLAKIRAQVLAGCHVVFSGIFPLQIEPAKLPNTKIWKTTELFGATVSLDITEHTTHLIAVKSGTLKVARAQQMGVKVIHLGWLRDCVKYFTKVDEGPYLLSANNTAHFKVDKSVDIVNSDA